MSRSDLLVGIPLAAALSDTIAIIVVLVGAKDRRAARSFVAVASCMLLISLMYASMLVPDFAEGHSVILNTLRLGLMLSPAATLHNAAVWSALRGRRVRALIMIGYALAVFFCFLLPGHWLIDGFIHFPWGVAARPGPLFPAYIAFTITWTALGFLVCLRAARKADDPAVRLRATYWVCGVIVAFPPGLSSFLVNYGIAILPLGGLGTVFAVVVIAYAAVRHRVMDVDVFVIRSAATLLASVAIVVPIAATIIWLRHLPVGISSALVVGCLLLAAIISLLGFSRLRSWFEQEVETSLFPNRRAARDAIRQLSQDLVKLPYSADWESRFTTTLMNGLGLSGIALYLYVARRATYKLACAAGAIRAPDRLDVAYAGSGGSGSEGGQAAGASVGEVYARALQWELYVPVRTNGSELGILALAPKVSGAAIDDADQALVAMVAAHVAVAVKNAEYVREINSQKREIEELEKRVEAENVALRAEVRSASPFKEIIGSSKALQRVLAMVEKVAPTDASILIVGETGTGKELIARAIHDLSPRSSGPLITVNCPAIPPGLAESDLFGHERGAFTDAIAARPGKFELAHGGTIFLDEVADLAMPIQVKLLRVLQNHETQRVGGRTVRKLDLRVVAATNRDLQEEVRAQRFREDLYYRLAAVPVSVPPLRDRVDDIPMLASFFLERAAAAYQKAITGFTPDAVTALCRYNWPGNIRELQHVVERAVLLCTSDVITPEHLSDLAVTATQPLTLGTALRNEKLRRVKQALIQSGGNQAAAARLLGLSRSNFARLLKNLGLRPPNLIQ